MGVPSWYPLPRPTKAEIEQRRKKEQEEKDRAVEDIDGDINWAYSQMRIVEAWLEEAVGSSVTLTEEDQKRIDKALVVTRTGLKMLKKVAKARAPHLSTSAWKTEGVTHNA